MTHYWVNTVSRDHVRIGIEGSFTQANHGRATMLRHLARGDLVAFYSPRTSYPDGEPLQRFTAVGRVVDDTPYQVEMTPTFHPWRRQMLFLACEESPIQPLVDELSFITDKTRWGYPFRRGLFKISAHDFERIARSMQVELGNR
jgi:EVE domain